MTLMWGQDKSCQSGKCVALDTGAGKTVGLNQLPKF